MKKLNTVHMMVQGILEDDPKARDDDHYLFNKVVEKINPSFLYIPFATANLNYKMHGVPDPESVGRARRKVQEKREDLRASKNADDARYESFKEYREYVQE